jgi:hypothetical protein
VGDAVQDEVVLPLLAQGLGADLHGLGDDLALGLARDDLEQRVREVVLPAAEDADLLRHGPPPRRRFPES